MVNDESNIILSGTKIVIPKKLDLAHEGHQGLIK